jgi:uncharacterized protein YrrD
MVWWLTPWCVSMRSWVKSIMDVCIDISCTNVIYKYVHKGEWYEKLFVDKIRKIKT